MATIRLAALIIATFYMYAVIRGSVFFIFRRKENKIGHTLMSTILACFGIALSSELIKEVTSHLEASWMFGETMGYMEIIPENDALLIWDGFAIMACLVILMQTLGPIKSFFAGWANRGLEWGATAFKRTFKRTWKRNFEKRVESYD